MILAPILIGAGFYLQLTDPDALSTRTKIRLVGLGLAALVWGWQLITKLSDGEPAEGYEGLATGDITPTPLQEGLRGQTFLRVVAKMLFPFVLVFGVYVITHGELGPGGGFQGGVILAAAFILYGMIMGVDELTRRVPPWITDALMALGVLLYAGTGLHNLLKGGAFLDYTMLGADRPGDAEALGMTLVEYGVGITVCSVMITIYTQICERAPNDVGVFTRVRDERRKGARE